WGQGTKVRKHERPECYTGWAEESTNIVLSNRRLDLHEFRGRQWLSFCFEFPKTIRDALRAFHAAVIVAAHLRASLIHAADVVSLAACCFDLLERVAAFWNREVVFCLPA